MSRRDHYEAMPPKPCGDRCKQPCLLTAGGLCAYHEQREFLKEIKDGKHQGDSALGDK